MNEPSREQPVVQQTVVIVGKQKSVGVAFLLAFLFGPLGLLYASVVGGLVMMVVAVVVGIITLGFGLIPVWFASMIWAVVAANGANNRLATSVNINANVGSNPTRAERAKPITEATVPALRRDQEAAAPKQAVSTAQSALDLGSWVTVNRTNITVAAVGFVVLLIAVAAMKFVFGLNFNRDAVPKQPAVGAASQAQPGAFNRAIPTPLVPITAAAEVLPSWQQSEDIEGNYPILTGLYVGALGKRPFKVVVSAVDTTNLIIRGYSETSSGQTAFEGSYNLTVEEPNSRVPSNVISFRTWVFQATLFEPDGVSGNGVFQLRFSCTDAQGASVYGTWTSYDGRLYREIRLFDQVTALNR